MSFADQLVVFYGRITHSEAQIYVRVSALVGGGEWSVSGQVRGPFAPGTRTLPTTVALTDLGNGATLLGCCSVPDPAFWTTQLPCTYEVTVHLRRAGEVVETVTRSLGIRFFGASRRNFLWEGKRWVMRGVAAPAGDVEVVEAFRDNAGVIMVRNPSDALLDAASLAGVTSVVELERGDLQQSVRRLSRWPTVAIVILPSAGEVDGELRAVAPNLLFGQRIDVTASSAIADWAQVVFCDVSHVGSLGMTAKSSSIPIVVERRLNGNFTLVEARRECDRLQGDLVSLGDFAGYVVQVEGVLN